MGESRLRGNFKEVNSKMKKIAKILSVVLCMVMVLGLMATTTFAAETTMTMSALGIANGVDFGTQSVAGVFSVTTAKGSNSSGNTPKYYTSGTNLRIYTGNTMTITPAAGVTISSITITCTSSYGFNSSVAVTNGNTVDGTNVVITPTDGTQAVVITNNKASNAQLRITAIKVSYSKDDTGSCAHPESNWGSWEFNNDGHWKSCNCGAAVKFAEAAHNPVNYVCECGYIQLRDLPTDSKAVVDAAFSLATGEALSKYYTYTNEITLTGVVTTACNWNSNYSNGTIYFDVEGTTETKNMQAYKLVAGTGLTEDDVKGLAVGDTVTISGSVIKNYNGTIEFDGSKLVSVVKAGAGEGGEGGGEVTPPAGDDDDDNDDDVVVTPPAGGTGSVEGIAPVNGATIKLGLWQNGMGKFLYFNGEVANNYYLGTTEDFTAAVNLTVEKVDGGWLLWFMKDGTKTYIDMVASGTYVNAVMVTSVPTPLTWNETYKTFTKNVNDTDYFFGTYTKSDGTNYSTISCSKLSYLSSGDSNYPTHLYTEVPAKTGDISSVFVALLAVSAIGAGALISKKGKFVA